MELLYASLKLVEKERIGGKLIKHHDEPKTPYQRIMDSGVLTVDQMNSLKHIFEGYNPFDLKKELEKQLKWFFKIVDVRQRELSGAG